jgi:hypothetical protein
MKCQINKKNNSQCDKDSIINENDLNMCKQHYKAFVKNKFHQYGTTKDTEQCFNNLTIKDFLFSRKIQLSNLND